MYATILTGLNIEVEVLSLYLKISIQQYAPTSTTDLQRSTPLSMYFPLSGTTKAQSIPRVCTNVCLT